MSCCNAYTLKNNPCKNYASENSEFCHVHQNYNGPRSPRHCPIPSKRRIQSPPKRLNRLPSPSRFNTPRPSSPIKRSIPPPPRPASPRPASPRSPIKPRSLFDDPIQQYGENLMKDIIDEKEITNVQSFESMDVNTLTQNNYEHTKIIINSDYKGSWNVISRFEIIEFNDGIPRGIPILQNVKDVYINNPDRPIDFSRFPSIESLAITNCNMEIDLIGASNTLKNVLLDEFNGSIRAPNGCSVKSLMISGDYDKVLDLFPFTNLEALIIMGKFNQTLTYPTNNRLKFVMFGNSYNKPVNFNRLQNLKCLVLGDAYNFNMSFPNGLSLEALQIGNGFNRLLDLSSVDTLKHLNVGDSFNSSLILPRNGNLESLHLGKAFQRPQDIQGFENIKY